MTEWNRYFSCALLLALAGQAWGQMSTPKLTLGVRAGAARFDADAVKPQFSPMGSGILSYAVNPNLSFAGELGYAELKVDDTSGLTTRIIPLEVEAVFRLLPYRKITPFASIGGGGVWWRATRNGQVIGPPAAPKKQEGLDSFLKSSGGLQISLSKRLSFNVGATFRYSLTDALDQKFSGDENDAVVSLFSGLTLNLATRGGERDGDRDGVVDALDLAPQEPEDSDGYLDHDGMPEEPFNKSTAKWVDYTPEEKSEGAAPIVIHEPVRWTEAGKPLRLQAEILAPGALEKIAVLYRERGTTSWQLNSMEKLLENSYVSVLPPEALRRQGMEYCIVAVEQQKKGLGYSGLPTRPNLVQVLPDQRRWRAIASFAAIVGWGASAYLAFRSQK